MIEKLGLFVEFYGFLPKEDENQHYFNTGLTYLISYDFQLDFGIGLGLNDHSSDQVCTIGFSYRIKTSTPD